MKNETTTDNSSKVKLIYYFDALCGWCYGFSPVISKINQEYGDQLEIEVVSGGLFLGNRAGFVNDVAPHIKSGAYKAVEAKTGVKFGSVFLDDVFGEGKMVLNSLPPTIALSIVKEEKPEHALKFAELLLKAVYYDGLNPIDQDGLADCATTFGFNKEDFKRKLGEEKYRKATEAEFTKFRSSQYSGMPALVVLKDGKENLLSHGYSSFEAVKLRLEPFLGS